MNDAISSSRILEDDEIEVTLRPQKLSDFVGQEKVKDNLAVFIEAAKQRGEALDHVLLYGPPGLGKTTLAMILSRELEVDIKSTSGPVLELAFGLSGLHQVYKLLFCLGQSRYHLRIGLEDTFSVEVRLLYRAAVIDARQYGQLQRFLDRIKLLR